MKNAHAGDGYTDEVLKVKLKNFDKVLEIALQYFGLLEPKENREDDDKLIQILQAAKLRTKHMPVIDVIEPPQRHLPEKTEPPAEAPAAPGEALKAARERLRNPAKRP